MVGTGWGTVRTWVFFLFLFLMASRNSWPSDPRLPRNPLGPPWRCDSNAAIRADRAGGGVNANRPCRCSAARSCARRSWSMVVKITESSPLLIKIWPLPVKYPSVTFVTAIGARFQKILAILRILKRAHYEVTEVTKAPDIYENGASTR